jgi:hypothetical protein
MSKTLKITTTVGLLIAMGACGGSSNPDQVSRVITGPNALNIGTESTTESATGLPFAIDFDPETDEISGNVAVRLVRFETDYESGVTQIIISDEVLTVPPGTEDFSGTITYKGETITLVDDGDDFEGDLSNGQTLFGFVNVEGDFASAFSLYTYVADEIGFDSEGSFILGFETNPNDLPEDFGITTYTGAFAGYGNIIDSDGAVFVQEEFIDGTVMVDVSFSDGGVSGELDINTETLGGTTFIMDPTSIVGNGFSTTATTVAGCESCSSSTQIGGAFFGPGAEELAGLAGIDFTDTQGEEDLRLVGAGAYVATPTDLE